MAYVYCGPKWLIAHGWQMTGRCSQGRAQPPGAERARSDGRRPRSRCRDDIVCARGPLKGRGMSSRRGLGPEGETRTLVPSRGPSPAAAALDSAWVDELYLRRDTAPASTDSVRIRPDVDGPPGGGLSAALASDRMRALESVLPCRAHPSHPLSVRRFGPSIGPRPGATSRSTQRDRPPPSRRDRT